MATATEETKQIKNDKFLENLGEVKNYWNAIHIAADKMSEKLVAGKIYLFIQSTTGSVIVDTASRDTWDEQLVGMGGDIIGGIMFSSGIGTIVNVALTSQGYSIGDILKDYYKDIKTGIEEQYWKYEENISVMVGGQMVTYKYAKVKCDADGNYIMNNITHSPILEEVSQLTYSEHYKQLKELENTFLENSISIEKINGDMVLKQDDVIVLYEKDIISYIDKDNNILSSVSLKEGQTISHIAQKTPYNSIDLLEYNNLSLEEAKSLPVGFKVRIPKDIQRI